MLSKMRKMRDKKGFTLIELMIVIAIIAILAAIAVPQFMSYRMRAYNSGAKAIAHNLKADEGNLNSELGVYGHTEAAAAVLSAADAGQAAADTNTVPALRIAATATVAGARLVGTTTAALPAKPSRTLAIPIALGANMTADVRDINNANDDSTYHIFTRHFKGDTAYAIDNDVENQLLSVSNPAWPNVAGLQATAVAAALPAADDVNNQAGGGAPTANWTPVP